MLENVLIRADGSKDIGMGHINRALIISNYLATTKGSFCTLITKISDSTKIFLESKLEFDNKFLNVIWIPEHTTLDEEIEFILNFQKSNATSFFVIDLLEESRPQNYVNSFKNKKIKIMLFSDSSKADNSYCDYFINGNPCLDANSFADNKYNIKRFCGIENFIMSENHIFHEANDPSKLKKYRLLVTIGATDHNNILFKVLRSLDKVKKEHEIEVLVVASDAAGYSEDLKNILKSSTFDSNLKINLKCLSEVWEMADIAITAGGNTLFERVAAGLPGMTVTQLARQSKISERFEELDVNTHIGFGPDLELDFISNRVNNFLSNKEAQRNQFLNCKRFFKNSPLDNIFLNFS